MPHEKPILIVGSINMDLIARVPHVPAPGETILGHDFVMLPGGKGANQAVAAALLAGEAQMLGRVGNDELGKRLLAELQASGVDIEHVYVTDGVSSGIAMISVDDRGENAIVVASGANFAVTPNDVLAARLLFKDRVCVVQLELPVETVCQALALCRETGDISILDPAPAPCGPFAPELLQADIVSPNETEAAALTKLPPDTQPEDMAEALHRLGARKLVLKLGARGCYVSSQDFQGSIPGFKVNVVDTTAAGDAFTGALAVALSEGQSLRDAARFANAAGALACTKRGAQPAMPTRREVERLIATNS